MSATAWICTSMRKSVIRVADDISKQITDAMMQYSGSVKTDIANGLKSVESESLAKVKSASPRSQRKRKKGKRYYQGWKVDTVNKNGLVGFVIHQNNDNYRLTHLLEDGHKTRNRRGWVSSQPHIREVERWAEAEAMKVIEKAVKG